MLQDKKPTGWKARLSSFKYAFKGIHDLFKSQPNAKIHAALAVLAIAAGGFFKITLTEWGLILFAIGMVLAAEAFNTALEYLTDLVSPDYHPLAGKAKDASAGAVLICAFCAAGIGLLIFLPKVVMLLS